MVFPSHGYRGATLPVAHLASGDLEATPLLLAMSSPTTVFPSCGYRGGDAADALYWRRLQRLILATPSTSYTGDAFRVLYWRRLQRLVLATPSASCTGDAFRVLYWRRLPRLVLATPSASCTGDASSVLAMPGAINLLTLTLALTLTSTLVDAWGRGTCRSGMLKVSPAPSTWHFPYG